MIRRIALHYMGPLVVAAMLAAPAVSAAGPCYARNVVLHLQQYMIHLAPAEPRCVAVGGTFEVRLPQGNSVTPAVGDVTVHEKSAGGVQIRGSNDPDANVVVVSVDGTAAAGTEVAYLVEIRGVGKLDPVVRVVGGGELRSARWNAYVDMLSADLGMTLEEASELNREFGETAAQ